MTINRNDPRWTAYVLDELDAPERAAFEREMAADPEAENILAEIRDTVLLLEDSLASAAPAALSAEQRRQIQEAAAPARTGSRFSWAAASGIAAVLLLGFAGLMTVPRFFRSPDARQIAEVRTVIEPGFADGSLESPGETADGLSEDQRVEAGDETLQVTPALPRELAGSPDPAAPTRTLGPEEAEQSAQPRRDSGQRTDLRFEADDATARVPAAGAGAVDEEERAVVSVDQDLSKSGASVGRLTEPGEVVSLPAVSNNVIDSIQADSGVRGQPGGASGGVGGGTFVAELSRAEAPLPAPPPPPPAPGILPDAATRNRFNTEEYDRIVDNPFVAVSQDPLATFSADVDTASYANVRRFLSQGTLPPRDAVRIEELLNYFTYDYAPPADNRPVRVHAEVASAPWTPAHRLVRIGIKGQEIDLSERAPSNLVFLIDVSGSMGDANKLPLLKEGMRLLVDKLEENDRVAVVVYAGASGLVLPSTPGNRKQRILAALDRLSAGGSTNGGAGIRLAYDTAVENFIEGGVNRVILATDGDFNVGVTNNGELTRLIEERAASGVFLSVLGFGTGNYNDAGLEALADQGNGNYAYIDRIREARKVLVEEMGSTLVTIAKDVKLQVEFNPAEVRAYRLIGYENRVLEDQDFNDDAKDAGEIGAGHTVTALFEVVPAGVDIDIPGVDPLRYQTALQPTEQAASGELLTVRVRYKDPDRDESRLIEVPVRDDGRELEAASTDFRFQSAVAAFGMVLRDSPYKGSATFDSVLEIAEAGRGEDREGYREEFIQLVRRARAIRDLGQ